MLLNDKQFSLSLSACFCRASREQFHYKSSKSILRETGKYNLEPGDASFVESFCDGNLFESVSRYIGSLVFRGAKKFHERKFDASSLHGFQKQSHEM